MTRSSLRHAGDTTAARSKTLGFSALSEFSAAQACPHRQSQSLSHIPGGNIATAYFRPQLPPELEFDTDRPPARKQSIRLIKELAERGGAQRTGKPGLASCHRRTRDHAEDRDGAEVAPAGKVLNNATRHGAGPRSTRRLVIEVNRMHAPRADSALAQKQAVGIA